MPAESNPGPTLSLGTNSLTDSFLLFFPPAPCQGMRQLLGWVLLAGSVRRREQISSFCAGGWCCAEARCQCRQGCGARQESCVAGRCRCVSGCQSLGISSGLDSCANRAGKLTREEVTVRKWKRLEAYQGVKPHRNIPPGQIRITLVR